MSDCSLARDDDRPSCLLVLSAPVHELGEASGPRAHVRAGAVLLVVPLPVSSDCDGGVEIARPADDEQRFRAPDRIEGAGIADVLVTGARVVTQCAGVLEPAFECGERPERRAHIRLAQPIRCNIAQLSAFGDCVPHMCRPEDQAEGERGVDQGRRECRACITLGRRARRLGRVGVAARPLMNDGDSEPGATDGTVIARRCEDSD